MFNVNNKDTRTMPLASFWYLYCSLWTYFYPCSTVSIVNFEQVNAGWGNWLALWVHLLNNVKCNYYELSVSCSLLNIYKLIFLNQFFKFGNTNTWKPSHASTLGNLNFLWILSEAATGGVMKEKVFWEILQNSQENTCFRVSFLIKLQTPLWGLWKKESLEQVFSCEFSEIYTNTFFYRLPLGECFCPLHILKSCLLLNWEFNIIL